MSWYLINGGQPLKGEVSIRGAKNAAFKQIIASMLSRQSCHLTNIPQISDTKITQSIARNLGAHIQKTGEHSLKIITPKITSSTVPQGTGPHSRASFMFLSPLLIRTHQAVFPLPGGDKLGSRPLDRLFNALQKMGVHIHQKQNQVHLHCCQLKPIHYRFPKPSHTVTEVLVMLASLIPGQTVLENTALEPEIDDLILMLNRMGAKIKRHPLNPQKITITGVARLKAVRHQVIPDRNEAVTFACAALATKGSVNILRVRPQHLTSFLETIKNMGASVQTGQDEISIAWTQPLKSVDIQTKPHPGFMTDWQAVFSVLLTQAIGISTVVERIYPYRFHHVPMLQKMGAKIKYFNPKISQPKKFYYFNPNADQPNFFHAIKIYGPSQLKPIQTTINDLRSGACVALAALTAPGQSLIKQVEYIRRGYEDLASRLRYLGASIEYIKTKK